MNVDNAGRISPSQSHIRDGGRASTRRRPHPVSDRKDTFEKIERVRQKVAQNVGEAGSALRERATFPNFSKVRAVPRKLAAGLAHSFDQCYQWMRGALAATWAFALSCSSQVKNRWQAWRGMVPASKTRTSAPAFTPEKSQATQQRGALLLSQDGVLHPKASESESSRRQAISKLAEQYYAESGYVGGRDLDNWVRAESIHDAQLAAQIMNSREH